MVIQKGVILIIVVCSHDHRIIELLTLVGISGTTNKKISGSANEKRAQQPNIHIYKPERGSKMLL